MQELLTTNLNNPILSLVILKDSDILIVADSNTTLSYLNKTDLEFKTQLKANALQDKLYNKSVAISKDGSFLAMASNGYREFKLFNLKTKKLIAVSSRNKGGVSCVAIDPKNRYAFSCGEDGSIYAIDIKSTQLAFVMPRHIDSITDIVFNDNATLIATASFDKSVIVFDLGSMDTKAHLRGSVEPVSKLLFLPQRKLLSIDKSNNAIVWDLDTNSVHTRLQGLHDDVTSLILVEDRYFLASSKLGYIMLYDAKNYNQISYNYIKISQAILSMEYDSKSKLLYVGTDGGDILVYNLFQDLDTIATLFKAKKYQNIIALAEKNPILLETKPYLDIDILWGKILKLAREQLEKGNQNSALKLCIDFLDIPSKKQELQKLLDEFKEFGKFLGFISQNKLSLAYAIAQNHPIYQESEAYKNLENKWLNTIAVARKAIENKLPIDEVKNILAPYRGIAQKNMIIQDILLNSLSLNRFKSALAENDLKTASSYVKKYPCLKETKDYNAFIAYVDNLYITAAKDYQSGNLIAAIKVFRVLVELDDFKSELEPLIKNIEAQQEFNKTIVEGEFEKSYKLLDNFKFLQSSDEAKELISIWESDYEKASEFASVANVDGIKEVLEKYFKIDTKYVAIATVVSWCYISELTNAIKNGFEQKIIEDGIKKFILYFGIIEQIEIFYSLFKQRYGATKLKLESLPEGSMKNFRPAMIVKSILE